ncbi:MAG: histidine phosphatase family protein [Pseudomonadales bacterium]
MAAGLVLYVIRHGQTEWNVAGRMQGRLDSPLTERGRRQADVHGRTLARDGGVDRLIVSPSGRTRATAELLNAHLAAPLRFEDALMERDCGAWSGLTIDEIASRHPEAWRGRLDDPYHHRPPEGENLPDMERRVAGLLDELLAAGAGRVALVTHGVMSRVIVKRLLALDPAEAARVRHPNELCYRVVVGGSGGPEAAHFVDGDGPRGGLLRHEGDGTIPGSHSNTHD